jgi:hypothetical protein
MNFSIEDFAAGVKTTDLFLYAGVAIVIWILFKDQILTLYKSLLETISKKQTVNSITNSKNTTTDNFLSKILDPAVTIQKPETKDHFYDLVVSWKQTRDLAVKNGCNKAVEVADQMFPFLSPSVCTKESEK